MKWNAGVLVGVVCGVLVMGGCSKGPEEAAGKLAEAKGLPDASADVAQVLGGGEPSAQTVACLAEGITYDKVGLERVIEKPRESITAPIPEAELLYWEGEVSGQRYAPSRAVYCDPKVEQARNDGAANQLEAFDSAPKKEKSVRDMVDEELFANPFGVFNAVVAYRLAADLKFQPSSKGEFEKTADYAARIASEKAAFEKANSGKKISIQDIEYAWLGLFGTPTIKSDGIDPTTRLYDPDTEILSLTIVPVGKSLLDPVTTNYVSHYPFEIPVKIKLTPEQAQKLFKEYRLDQLVQLQPVVAFQLHNGSLIVREVSFKDRSYVAEENFKRMGFKLDHIPVNFELSKSFLSP